MLAIHHFIQFFLLPPINGILWLVVSLLFWYQRKVFCLGIISGLVLIYLQYTPWFAGLISNLIYPPMGQKIMLQQKPVQAIVVLGAGSGIDLDEMGGLQAYPVGTTLKNIEVAKLVAAENPKLPIYLSGGYTSKGFSEARAMSNYLQQTTDLVNPVVLEEKSLDTDQNALYTAGYLKKSGINSVILVTQASHMWRSTALLQKRGVDCVQYPAWNEYLVPTTPWGAKFIPSSSAVKQTDQVLHELIGYLVYVIF